MPALLYFRPHHLNPMTLADVRAWGLGYAFSADPEQTVCQSHTPDGSNGTVFQDASRAGDTPLKMDLDEQRWQQVPATDCWVGCWKEQVPTPAELARPHQLPGHVVTLSGGREWKIPLVRRFNQATALTENALPAIMQCGPDGKWTREKVIVVHAHLWELTQPFADDVASHFIHGTPLTDFLDQQIFDTATALLQTNYTVGVAELSLLEAFASDAGAHAAILAACDLPSFLVWSAAQKKTRDQPVTDGASTSAGKAS